MHHTKRYVHALAQCALWLAFGANASVVFDNIDNINEMTVVAITGEITKDDAAKISDLVRRGVQKEKRRLYQYRVLLDSRGGDLDAAMAIGRTLKTTTAWVMVSSLETTECGPKSMPGSPYDGWLGCDRKPATCASACVLILAAGSQKTAAVYGHSHDRVGIHRPYSATAGATTAAQGGVLYTAMATRVRAYLEEIGMPGRLYEEMMLVPPEKVRWLTMEDLERLGLLGMDPAYEDAKDSEAAAAHRISKQEWLRRKSLADEACLRPKFDSLEGKKQSAAYDKWDDCLKQVYDYGSAPR